MTTSFGFGNASLLEILWTACAAPGLWVWVINLINAAGTQRAARRSGIKDGRLVWASFSVLLTGVFAFVEIAFMLIGGIALVRPPNPGAQATGWLTWVLTLALMLSSALITAVGLRWRAVDLYLVAAARARKAPAG